MDRLNRKDAEQLLAGAVAQLAALEAMLEAGVVEIDEYPRTLPSFDELVFALRGVTFK